MRTTTAHDTDDILNWAKKYDGPKFHALLCDPPYHLTSIVKRNRSAKGFMGQDWDGGDIAFRAETWAAIAEHLHPGAFGMAFSGSRTWHRMAVAIEDAGLLIHPTVYVWVYGSGFPKATRIDTQIDRAAGLEIEQGKAFNTAGKGERAAEFDENGRTRVRHEPQTEQARQWARHRYGAQALKPAAEPIIVFQKPYEGRPIDSMLATGAGALNIGATKIAGKKSWPAHRKYSKGQFGGTAGTGSAGMEITETLYEDGRWPANFALSHHPECGEQCHADCNVRKLDEQTGVSRSQKSYRGDGIGEGYGGSDAPHNTERGFADEGGGSRYFFNADFMLDRLEDTFVYQAKAGKKERNAGLDSLPLRPAGGLSGRRDGSLGGKAVEARNVHPTVKPIALVEHLAKLLLPPDGYERRLLVPFSGSGSEMIGAMRAGWDFIQGVELSNEYAEIAKARLAHWENERAKLWYNPK